MINILSNEKIPISALNQLLTMGALSVVIVVLNLIIQIGTSIAAELSRDEAVNKIAIGITALADPKTGLAPSHYGHPEFEFLSFTYDKAVSALALYAAGKQNEAEKILDYFDSRVHIPLEDVKARVNNQGIYGILKLFEGNGTVVKGLVNGLDITSTKRQGQGQLEYFSTPGPIAFIGLAFLSVNSEKYREAALVMGEVVLAMQQEDGGVYDGDRLSQQVHTEPHMDAVDFLYELYLLTGDTKWKQAAERGWNWFRENVYHPESGTIDQGNGNLGRKTIFATDAYSWTMAGHFGDQLTSEEIIRLSDHMLEQSLTRVTVQLPDETIRELTLVDFTDPTTEQMQIDRQGLHPMGSVEWTAGVVLALQKNAVRLWKTNDARYQIKAKEYKAVAEILTTQSVQSFYTLPALNGGVISFYATGQNVEVGHGWRTPYFCLEGPDQLISGGSSSSTWLVLPMQGLNPFVVNDDYKQTLDEILLTSEDQKKAEESINRVLTAERIYREVKPTQIAADARKMVEPRAYNAKMWKAFLQGEYQEAMNRAMDVINEKDWIQIALRQQEAKAQEIGGLIDYPWGMSPEKNPELEEAISRYPLLNEMGTAMWAMAVSNFELGNVDEAKKWIRRIVTEIPLHQIYDPKGPGYWNVLVSWEYNPGGLKRDREMGMIYKNILSELGMVSGIPEVVDLRRDKNFPLRHSGTASAPKKTQPSDQTVSFDFAAVSQNLSNLAPLKDVFLD